MSVSLQGIRAPRVLCHALMYHTDALGAIALLSVHNAPGMGTD